MTQLPENIENSNLFIDPLVDTLSLQSDNIQSSSIAASGEDREASIASNNYSTESREKLMGALDQYKNSYSLTSNPLLNAAENSVNDLDRERRKNAEREASFHALNNIFQNVGGIISTIGGVKAPKVDTTAFDNAMQKIETLDANESKRHDMLLKSALSMGEGYNNDLKTMQEKYIDGLKGVYTSDLKRDQDIIDGREKVLERERKERYDNGRLDVQKTTNSDKGVNLSSYVRKSNSSPSQRYERYVYNANGEKVGITDEMRIKLHQIAKLYNIDGGYEKAPNMQKAQNEYDIMIQDAFLRYEKNQKK